MRLVLVGRVAGGFGVRGELRITTYTQDPMALLRYRDLRDADGATVLTLQGARAVKDAIITRAAQVSDKTAADALRGLRLYVPRDILPPPEPEEFYHADLIGLRAETPEGAVLGEIRAVHDFGAGDVLEIGPPDGRAGVYLPFTHAAVPGVDIAGGRVIVVPPDGEGDGDDAPA